MSKWCYPLKRGNGKQFFYMLLLVSDVCRNPHMHLIREVKAKPWGRWTPGSQAEIAGIVDVVPATSCQYIVLLKTLKI